MKVSLNLARAIATRCICPLLNDKPFVPSLVSYPSESSKIISSNIAILEAFLISEISTEVGEDLPMVIFNFKLSLKITGCCTKVTLFRIQFISNNSIFLFKAARVLFPDPLAPTTNVVFPAGKNKETFFNIIFSGLDG
ncbi:unnamed protein product [Pneumocystis jirovecii]|uniref:Uncharacterized protein n=1 Tax=Pneumocystis jirovecii TaxID=42068 RepID=L0PCD4_PNEJI|nr:unnamed protein product [Pneumocystis jirovecii]